MVPKFPRGDWDQTEGQAPPAVRWLGRLSDFKARLREGTTAASSITLAFKGGGAFNRLLKSGPRFLGRRCEIGVFDETRPVVTP